MPTLKVMNFGCLGEDEDFNISECAERTWDSNPLVEPPTQANVFWQNSHSALPETGFSKYCQNYDSFTLFTIVAVQGQVLCMSWTGHLVYRSSVAQSTTVLVGHSVCFELITVFGTLSAQTDVA